MTDMGRIADVSLKATLAAAQSEAAYLKERYAAALERERLLLEQLSTLRWQPITPENLPKAGDEVGMFPFDPSNYGYMVGYAMAAWMHADWKDAGWTHFRPINPPTVACATPPQDVEKS